MTYRRKATASMGLFLLLLLLVADRAGAADWSWQLSADRYRALNQFERVQLDKATELFKKARRNMKACRAAAAEFEKFKVMFPDSIEVPYAVFMQGLCLHTARDRNKARAIYQEVLDYFGDDFEVAPAALYFMGKAHLDNGDTKKGLRVMQDMVEHKDYKYHPLAASALQLLAENHWKNGEQDKALKLYQQIIRDFEDLNRRASAKAYERILSWYVWQRDYDAYESWYIGDTEGLRGRSITQTADRLDAAERIFPVAARGLQGGWRDRYGPGKDAVQKADKKAFVDYFESRRSAYERSNKHWTYYQHAIGLFDKAERDKTVDEALKWVEAEFKDPDAALQKYTWIADKLVGLKQYDKARFVYGKLTDPALANWKEYEILGKHEGKWKEAVRVLEAIEHMGDKVWQAKAERARADVYRERLGKYEDAVRLYQQINEPPGTLWLIKDCYRRWRKPKDELKTLGELSFFDSEKPRAAKETILVYERMGEKQKAIALARKAVKIHKGTGVDSWAHQFLEKRGIATGGGISDVDM